MKRANGTGSVFKMNDKKRRKPWRTRITLWKNGERIYASLGNYETKKEAVEALAKYQTNPRDLSLDKLTFKDVYNKWVLYEFPLLSENRQSVYQRIFAKCSSLENIKFRDLRHTDFSNILDTNTHSVGIEVKNLFSKVSKFAMKNDLIEKDYSQFLEYRKKHEVKVERNIFTRNEIDVLWDNVYKYSEIDTTLVMIYTGMRIGEIIGLKKDNIDLEERSISGAGIKTEAGKKRVIPIHPKIFPLIINRFKMTSSDKIFEFKGNNYGSKHQYYTRALDAFLKELKLPPHNAHDCRHTFATLLNNTDANGTAIKDLMGHNNFDFTEFKYTHKSLEELRKAIEKIN